MCQSMVKVGSFLIGKDGRGHGGRGGGGLGLGAGLGEEGLIVIRLDVTDNSRGEVKELLLALLRAEQRPGPRGWWNKSAYVHYSRLLPCFDLKNPFTEFINPEFEDVHSPLGG